MATEPRNDRDQQPVREREVIVTDNGGKRSGMSGAIVAVLAVVVIALIAWLAISMIGGGTSEDVGDNVEVDAPEVDVPDEVDVNVDEGGQ